MSQSGEDPSWSDSATWGELSERLRDLGVRRLHVKFLAPNDNSRHQIAGLGWDLTKWSHLHLGPVKSRSGSSRKPGGGEPIFHSAVRWTWLTRDGYQRAPEAKFVYHPQYSSNGEIRLSGLLRGTAGGHVPLLQDTRFSGSRGAEPGRILVFGPGRDRRVFGAVLSQKAPAAAYLGRFRAGEGELVEIQLGEERLGTKEQLFAAIDQIIDQGWCSSYRLYPDGSRRPCIDHPNCHGITLESELGITSNAEAGPDFLDWEVKGHRVRHLERHLSSQITLMTPNPDGGLVRDKGTPWLVEKYGTLRESGMRRDLGGVHVGGVLHRRSGLLLGIEGYDSEAGDMTSEDGYVYWTDPRSCELLATWSFAKLLTHWQTKHAKTIFVPCIASDESPHRYKYGRHVRVGEGTDFFRFLRALDGGVVRLDPGIKTELQPDGRWKPKTRYQFRVSLKRASALYERFSLETI